MSTCGATRNLNERYMTGPNIEGCKPSTFLPSVAANELSYQPYNSFPNQPIKKAPVTLPWKANSYYGVCMPQPNVACCDTMPMPISSTNKLRHLDGIKIPPIFAATRNSLYTRYTGRDWCLANQCNYQSSNRVSLSFNCLRFATITRFVYS